MLCRSVANNAIIAAIQLPDKYMITGKFADKNQLFSGIRSALEKKIKLVQFRAHHLSTDTYFEYAKKIHELCLQHGASLMLNCRTEDYVKYYAYNYSEGLHLSVKELKDFSTPQFGKKILISASTHNHEELTVARQKQVDFCVLSPVMKTRSHPDANPLGWEKFKRLCRSATVPVFALGGITLDDIAKCKNMGGHGISAIGAFWLV